MGQTAVVTPDPPGAPARDGRWLGIAAVVLGGFAVVLPLAPADLTGLRAWIGLPFALPGLLAGLAGLSGRRRGKDFAVTGTILCVIATVLAIIMLSNAPKPAAAVDGPGDHTNEVLRDSLDVRLGDVWYDDPDSSRMYLIATLYNKGPDAARFSVEIENKHLPSGNTCGVSVSTDNLAPGASYQVEVGSCQSVKQGKRWLSFRVSKANKIRS
ncbi:DUF308 domain-containing protein [Actinocrispum wychmicini]|uniref:Uncharacterized protein n=1 Tax=Actinocrispum wychmicini TaxID=1213861 RepID=A0A4R2JG72_9PSEU|nr:DUF308 domain-containing protein [Actinocrispum wychmicini]TCO55868.1 hypothetical protein EV192_107291 [Actinocrispum wychmicini]